MYVGGRWGTVRAATDSHREPEDGMGTRSRVIGRLEGVYREAYEKAGEAGDQDRMDALDFGFQRDQVMLEVLVDIRDLLLELRRAGDPEEPGLLDRARAIREFTKLGAR